ncbi:xylose isomerase [Paenibacillus contaminans]|uniref:Xylose isomerase n=1 Tax=Paenibacillus contaminans TaxID=450362 RepID=A0A329LZ98_9BACL|nr:xylose isomerase [Paenibacillus contaminans]RAV12640.1 xylose isomerase [Paenibacillus contaminans]
MSLFVPKKEDRFTFGLWTVGNPGRDPFGLPVREGFTPVEAVHMLAELGAYGVNFHDNDLVPIDATPAEKERIVREFRQALEATGLKVPMVTVSLFTDPIFKDGAFTSNDPRVRAYAIRKTIESMDLGKELGAEVFVLWGGREGAEVDAGKDAVDSMKRYREAVNYLCEYSLSQNYGYKFALEAKPNEPRGDIYLPTTGAMLGLIATLDHPEMVGVNPEVAHERMAGLNFYHAAAQALEAGKLFHIDLNDQKMGRFDQDLRFGSDGIKEAFFLVKLLEDYNYKGMLHFDAHALRTEDRQGVVEFAKGNMRTYLILKEKVKRFNADPDIQALLAEINGRKLDLPGFDFKYSPESLQALRGMAVDRETIGAEGLNYEKLDQLTMEIIMGVR